MLVSILIPCYQERSFIRGCLQSVQEFALPGGTEVEILVLDGMSTDGTREIVREIAAADARVRLIDNPDRYQAPGLNRAVAEASGELLIRLDVHATYPADYLSGCVETSLRTGAANVGGVAVTMARGTGYSAAMVQALTTHRFGVGDSGFRVGAAEGPVDTVPYGCFPARVFDEVGLFDERLVRAQDYEFNRRLARAGKTIWLNPAIQVRYFQQPNLTSFFRKQALLEAPYNAYMWWVAPYAFAPRHAVTAVFAAGVIGGILLWPLGPWIRVPFLAAMGLYGALALLSAVQQAARYRKPLHVVTLPFGFFAYHFLHGLGVLYGLARLLTGSAPVQRSHAWDGRTARLPDAAI